MGDLLMVWFQGMPPIDNNFLNVMLTDFSLWYTDYHLPDHPFYSRLFTSAFSNIQEHLIEIIGYTRLPVLPHIF
jgi:hypothetical protein